MGVFGFSIMSPSPIFSFNKLFLMKCVIVWVISWLFSIVGL